MPEEKEEIEEAEEEEGEEGEEEEEEEEEIDERPNLMRAISWTGGQDFAKDRTPLV